MLQKIFSIPYQLLNKFINTGFFKTIISNQFVTTILLVAIVTFWSFPSYDIAFVTDEMDENWGAVFLQGEKPFVNHNHLYGEGTHAEKLAFRFVPAILLNMLQIDSKLPALVFQFLTMALFYYLLLLFFNQFFNDRIKAFVYSLPFCFVVAGHVYASDYRGIFDTLALDFLLMSLLLRNRIYVIIPLLLAYFTDERALIASPAIFLINLLEKNKFDSFKDVMGSVFFPSTIYLIISWIVYFIVRNILVTEYGLNIGKMVENLFFDQINRTLYTIYIGLEGFIIPFIMVTYCLLKKRIYTFTGLLIVCFLVLFYVAQSVYDINRSMAYVLLVLLLIIMLLDKFYDREVVYKIVAWVITINIVYSDFYPLLVQLYRMKFITNSI